MGTGTDVAIESADVTLTRRNSSWTDVSRTTAGWRGARVNSWLSGAVGADGRPSRQSVAGRRQQAAPSSRIDRISVNASTVRARIRGSPLVAC